MPTRKTRAGTPVRTRPTKNKLVELCLDMEDALDQVVDVAHASSNRAWPGARLEPVRRRRARRSRSRRRRLVGLRTARHFAAGLPRLVQMHLADEVSCNKYRARAAICGGHLLRHVSERLRLSGLRLPIECARQRERKSVAMHELKQIYEQRKPTLQEACRRLQTILGEVVANIEDKTLVRAEVRSVRAKGLPSLSRKAAAKGWRADEVMFVCHDLVGGRVVCNNVEDVHRFAELLKERLPGTLGGIEIQDQIKNPNVGGYRALHVNFRLGVGTHPFLNDFVPCEVQIRSRLQDAWAELSHDDIYKQPDLPADLRARANDLAEVLAAADKIASDIRLRVMQETTPPGNRPELDRVSRDGLAFIFKDTFGRSPADYVVRQALNLCRDLGIQSLEQLPRILSSEDFREKVTRAYQSIMPAPFDIETFFLSSVYAMAKGESRAIVKVRRDARREWREIDEFATREMLSSLPPTISELVDQLEDRDIEGDVEEWAKALGVTSKCHICGTIIVDPSSFADAALRHYNASDDDDDNFRERIETAIRNSATETGGWGGGHLCAYHNNRMAKDD
jgi:ppGpp synthetase/RelA/SpoT-type nucleotidyltranferase